MRILVLLLICGVPLAAVADVAPAAVAASTPAVPDTSTATAAAPPDTSAAMATALPDTGLVAAGLVLDAAAAATADTLSLVAPPAAQIEPVDVWSTGVSSTAAVLMTPLFPGWGQLYTDNSWRAALAFGVEMFYWSNLLLNDRKAVRTSAYAATLEPDTQARNAYSNLAGEYYERMRDYAWWSGGVLLIIALDSYVGAHLFDFESDPVPVPNDWEGQFGEPGGDMPGATAAPNLVVFQYGWRF